MSAMLSRELQRADSEHLRSRQPAVPALEIRLQESERQSASDLQLGPALVVLAALGVVVPFIPGYWVGVLSQSLVYSMVALSLVLLTGFVGQISLAQGSLLGLGAFSTAALIDSWGLPYPLAVTAALVLCSGMGLLIGMPALRLRGLALAIATWSFALFFERFVLRQSWLTGGIASRSGPRPTLGPVQLGDDIPAFYFVALSLALAIVVVRNVLRGRTGHALVAVRDSEDGARALGINVTRAKLLAFALASLIAGAAGALQVILVPALGVDAYGQFVSVTMLAIAVIGGIESLLGAVLAGVAFLAFPQLLREAGLKLTGSRFDLGLGLALLAVVVARPRGLASLFARRRR